MTPHEIATKAAEEVLQVIERTKRIIKGDIAEAIEKVLLTNQVQPGFMLERPALTRSAACVVAPCPGGTRECYLPECVKIKTCMHREPGGAGYC